MKKILLTAINAKYIHSNPAVYSLRAYAKEYLAYTAIAEYTINQRTEVLLRELYDQQPDVLLFSCYIWNVRLVCELAAELKKVLPDVRIWVGGPEVSYEYREFLRQNPAVCGVLLGEGEATFCELCAYYTEQNQIKKQLFQIRGLCFRDADGNLNETGMRPLLEMDQLPFFYRAEAVGAAAGSPWQNRILYYESSRGCPFSCSYCLSSIARDLRFRSLPLVFQELSYFLEARVMQVKFVDRTFNCDHRRALAIWSFLKEHDNGVTNFHFEISADLLQEEELALLRTMRPGLVQLEIGVQTANLRTLREIRRKMDLCRVERAVRSIAAAGNMHQHLDLIAGLPFEDFSSFRASFDRIYRLHPQQLQLGFLKVLKGSYLYENRAEYALEFGAYPPYEVLSTRWLSYGELLKIKLVEEMLEVYSNSGQFAMTMQMAEAAFASPFDLFLQLGEFYRQKGLLFLHHTRLRRCEILLDFLTESDQTHRALYEEALTFDLYRLERAKRRPLWAKDPNQWKERSRGFRHQDVHIEQFSYDFFELLENRRPGLASRHPSPQLYVFSYQERDKLTGQAAVRRCEAEEDIC